MVASGLSCRRKKHRRSSHAPRPRSRITFSPRYVPSAMWSRTCQVRPRGAGVLTRMLRTCAAHAHAQYHAGFRTSVNHASVLQKDAQDSLDTTSLPKVRNVILLRTASVHAMTACVFPVGRNIIITITTTTNMRTRHMTTVTIIIQTSGTEQLPTTKVETHTTIPHVSYLFNDGMRAELALGKKCKYKRPESQPSANRMDHPPS